MKNHTLVGWINHSESTKSPHAINDAQHPDGYLKGLDTPGLIHPAP